MIIKIKHIVPVFFLLLIFSCTSTKKNTTTYFGGKIINPKSGYVILYQMEKVIDTFFLDNDGKFLGKLDSISKGLYYFNHGVEHQYLYLEPQDSLLIRLNTWDFDESLVFSGTGAKRNNMLIDCFLSNEKDSKKFYKYYSLSPSEMKLKVDSTQKVKLIKYNEFIEHNPDEAKGFKKLLKISLTYPLYSRLEIYPRAHKSCEKDHKNELSEIASTFYKHREEANINSDTLMYFNAYSDYVTNYLYNVAYSKTRDFSPKFTVNLLQTIDAKIQSEKIKNELLMQTVISHFYNNSTCTNYNNAFFTFFKLSTNIKHKKKVQRLVNDTKLELEGEKLSDFDVINFNHNSQPIHDVIKGKKSLLLFWTSKQLGSEYLISRIKYLKSSYPTVQFLLINIDKNKESRIDKLNIKSQFYIDKTSAANKFLSSKLSRTILINQKGVITNSYASLYSNKLLTQLKNLTKN